MCIRNVDGRPNLLIVRSPEASLRVTLDATPLLGNQTGIGVFTQALLNALLTVDDLEVAAFGLTGRNTHVLNEALPQNVSHNTSAMPAAVLTRLWKFVDHPKLDRWMNAGDVVHGTNFVVPPARNAARVVTVHDLTAVRYPQLCTPASRRYPELVRAAVKSGAHVHTLSRSAANDVQELLAVPSHRVHVIPPGIDPHPASSNAAVTPSAPYIFAIGTIEPRKDFPTLVKAFDIIASTNPDVQLLIAGDRGWGADAFDHALEDAQHASRIRVLGRISADQYDGLLRGASVLAYPSLYEGFGYPPLEAMRVGVPVVATNVASLPETCGDAAVLVEPRKPDALADALEKVLTDTNLREHLVKLGHERVLSLRWDEAATKFVALYKELAT
jgi:glycosyltransferase involved in cell wall biosynthesis